MKLFCSGYTKAALALAQFGWWSRAEDMFYLAMNRYHQGDDYTLFDVDTAESILWEQYWIKCAQHLNQW